LSEPSDKLEKSKEISYKGLVVDIVNDIPIIATSYTLINNRDKMPLKADVLENGG
jgi:hypothetical protein